MKVRFGFHRWARLLFWAALLALPSRAMPGDGSVLSLGATLGELPRFGLNLGGRNVWGADQLMRNVLQNPGLELTHDGALLIVGRVLPEGVEDDSRWTAREPGFWAGAHFEVLSGAAAGRVGRVLDNRRADRQGGDLLQLEPPPPGLAPGDVLALQGQQDMLAVPQWWTQGLVRTVAEPRPGSPGRHAALLSAVPGQPAALFHHLDSIGARAGKLLPVQGRWRLSFWARQAKSSAASARFRLSFARHGQAAWLDQRPSLGAEWQRFEFDFQAEDKGPVGPLQLSLLLEQGQVLLDDIELGSLAGERTSPFRDELIQTLLQLRPGYLRDWQGQLGDSLSNRLAPPLARRPSRYRPGPNERLFAYSLPEFLELCARVGARPWLVLPATLTPAEAKALGTLLAQAEQQHRFGEIVVEHGNEHWNSVFRPAGIARAEALAEVADRAFAALREGAGPALPLHRVIGTQYVNPAAAGRMAALSRQSQGIAVAPYFHYKQDAADSSAQVFERVLQDDVQPLLEALRLAAAQRHQLDVYEVNFHTTGGNASGAQRDAVLADAAAGTALARRLLQAALAGVRRQAVYALSGYDSFFMLGERRELTQLFGITRDLAGVGHWRPTGAALQALNEVAGGTAHAVRCQGPACATLTGITFTEQPGHAQGKRWALVNAGAQAQRIELACAQALRWRSNVERPGETETNSQPLACRQGRLTLNLPARSWATLQP
ncbi:hypothetical protein WG899_15500 [Paucibacter sp. AS339]|uniref:hypothetical protein n=1 Tax=Paucibacter hankyongi TaxID=3133434 RepID=UPI0030B2B51A